MSAVRFGLAVGLVFVMGAWGALSCSNDAAAPSAPPAPATIRIVQCPWDASRLDAAIARILLTEHMGVSAEVVDVDEYAQWDELASGEVHVSLEVWPSGHKADIASYIDTGRVENGGALGPIGKIGWYIPSYLLTVHPELAEWTGLQQAWAPALFESPDTAPAGRFVAGDTTWTQYDEDIIHNLGLDFKVVHLGTEDAEIAELDRLYNLHQPILMYMWTPQWALAKYDMTEVKLPDYSDECYAKAATHGIDCDYPPDPLFKVMWPGLAASAPRVHAFLRAFQYTTADQLQMLGKVHVEGMTIDQAARAWIDANPAIWQTWISPEERRATG